MKKDCPQHRKFKKLKRRLHMPEWQVIGLLESIWLLCQVSVQDGAIGSLTNEDIAASIEWDGDEDELVGHLVDCGFLDKCPTHRLVVHDWCDHAPSWLSNNLRRHGRPFACPSDTFEPDTPDSPDMSESDTSDTPPDGPKQAAKHPPPDTAKHATEEPAKEPTSYSSLTLPNLSKNKCPTRRRTNPSDSDFRSWYEIYPRKVHPKRAKPAFEKSIREICSSRGLSIPEAVRWLIEVTEEFAQSSKGRGEFCPHPATWLNAGGYDDDRAEWNRGSPESKTDEVMSWLNKDSETS